MNTSVCTYCVVHKESSTLVFVLANGLSSCLHLKEADMLSRLISPPQDRVTTLTEISISSIYHRPCT